MACVYDALGVRVTVVELSDGLMPGTDRDLVRPLQKRIEKRYERILLKTKVAKLEALPEGLRATFEGPDAPEPQVFDRVLVAVGRSANGNADQCGRGRRRRRARAASSPSNKQMRTNVPHIFAIGDIVGAPMLAHKATHEAKVAAEVAAGHKAAFDARCIPSVAYTDPEIAWVGVTETEAKARGIEYGKGMFPWAASGRSLALNRDEGFTKLLFDKQTHRVIGAGIVGTNAGELIAEVGLAIEMGADAADIGLTIHRAPDALRDGGVRGRGLRRHVDGSLHSQALGGPHAYRLATTACALLLALAFALAATRRSADDGCIDFKWDVRKERALFAGTPAALNAGTRCEVRARPACRTACTS